VKGCGWSSTQPRSAKKILAAQEGFCMLKVVENVTTGIKLGYIRATKNLWKLKQTSD
jgi:hypothetical protein